MGLAKAIVSTPMHLIRSSLKIKKMKKLTIKEMKKVQGGAAPACFQICSSLFNVCNRQSNSYNSDCLQGWIDCIEFECSKPDD
jgi:bacteriocin-like protein